MKLKQIVLFLLAVVLLGNATIGCTVPESQLEKALGNYEKTVSGEIPDDLRLTVYYVGPKFLTRHPLSVEDLKIFSMTQKIVVNSEELAANAEVLRKLDASVLQPVEDEDFYINARLYYVLETGESEILLEVIISEINGTAVVNGINVESNPVLYEIVTPFLTAEARDLWGL